MSCDITKTSCREYTKTTLFRVRYSRDGVMSINYVFASAEGVSSTDPMILNDE